MILYLHIPFCESKCPYCAFISYTNKNIFKKAKKAYSQAILKQLDFEIERFSLPLKSIDSVFIGGGTPSFFNHELLKPFMQKLSPFLSDNAEMTTEANPNSASLEWLLGMRELGFNRISFGVQSFDDKKLKFLGRIHDGNAAKKAVLRAREAGFGNISVDIIYALAMDTKRVLENDIKTSAALPINHISAYSLTIEAKTPFFERKNAMKESLTMAKFIVRSLKDENFLQYEVSNFSRGYECLHNKRYWAHDSYIGVGCGAVGFDGQKRFYPSNDLKEYIASPLLQKTEHLSAEDLRLERLFLAFRSNLGISLDFLPKQFENKIDMLVEAKKVYIKDGRLYNKNYFLADEIALFLS
ncbi:MAG: radical SAM family heme chaperone HemW [Campylobacteraceae bacterium]|nr:radical SAM family heme chaperone HemW [Campylobacteraceae bacterium]